VKNTWQNVATKLRIHKKENRKGKSTEGTGREDSNRENEAWCL